MPNVIDDAPLGRDAKSSKALKGRNQEPRASSDDLNEMGPNPLTKRHRFYITHFNLNGRNQLFLFISLVRTASALGLLARLSF